MKKETAIILCDIRSAENVGAIFRTADAAEVAKIYLTGITPRPKDQFGRVNSKIAKAALSAEAMIAWEHCVSAGRLLGRLKKKNHQIIAIEQTANSVDYKKVKPKFPVVLVLGNEVEGLPKSVLAKCDVVAEIPMLGQKESLNVSVAAGIAMFRLLGL